VASEIVLLDTGTDFDGHIDHYVALGGHIDSLKVFSETSKYLILRIRHHVDALVMLVFLAFLFEMKP